VTKLLLSIHVLAAIIAIGPVTVAASMFPATTRRALFDRSDPRGVAVLRNLHRICRVYAALGILVPLFGLATASSLGVLGDAWLIISIILTTAAAAVLALLVLPGQAATLAGLSEGPTPASLPGEPTPAGLPGEPTPASPSEGPTPASHTAAGVGGRPAAATTGVSPSSPEGAISAGTIDGRAVTRLGMVTGVFNLLWAIVVVLMIVRPGSTTGV